MYLLNNITIMLIIEAMTYEISLGVIFLQRQLALKTIFLDLDVKYMCF